MSFSNFTVQKLDEYQGLPDGDYTAQVDHIECVQSDFGKYYVVQWKIMRPSEFEGRVHKERFNIEHSNDQVRHIAIQSFSKFCMDIGELNEGDVPHEDLFLYKIANILIRNKAAKDGKTYANVVRRQLANPAQQAQPSHLGNSIGDALGAQGVAPEPVHSIAPTAYPSANLNDDVPF